MSEIDRYFERKNVLGQDLVSCSFDPVTGFFRDGHCNTSYEDHGVHTVCVKATEEFLEFSRRVGNDLSTPRPEYGFSGVRPGDFWCLCAGRFLEAHRNNKAPFVHLAASHEESLAIVPLEILKKYAIDL